MAPTHNLTHAAHPLTDDDLAGVLLEVTGDLDKADVLKNTLPAWLVQAKPAIRHALAQACGYSQCSRERATRLLQRLQPLHEFCTERLTAFLTAKGHGALDVEHDCLELYRRSLNGVGADFGGMLTETLVVEKSSLLQAAMQNFSWADSRPGRLLREGLIRIGATREVAEGISAEVFVGYCRELDLGRAYQQHVQEVFNLPSPGDAVDLDRGYNPALPDIGRSMAMEMQIGLHIASGKGDISESTYTLLLALTQGDAKACERQHLLLRNKPLIWQGLNIGGACLWGVMVFSHDSPLGFSSGPVLVYMPNEPHRPWYEYAALDDFKLYLSLKLQVADYRTFFTGYLDEAERFEFFERFDKTKTLDRVEPIVETGSLWTFFFNVCVGKIQLDACVLAVPKEQVDEDARQKRWRSYLDAGLTVLNLAAFVVPVLGQLMMGVAVGQIVGEVFEGIEDWSYNDKTGALEHLVSVAENLALMMLLAAGGKALASRLSPQAESRAFFERMEAVEKPGGGSRLWRVSLADYRQVSDVSAHTGANRQGIYQFNGQSYIKMDGWIYSIAFDARIARWRIRHPLREAAFRPPLEHNRQGGWRSVFEHPQEWNYLPYALTRLDPALASLSDTQLLEIADITALTKAQLYELLQEARVLPARFRDCAMRLKLNAKVRDLDWQLEHQSQPDPNTARTQLTALPMMPGWPTGRFFEVLDNEGYLLERYPDTAPFDYEDLSIHITDRQLEEGKVMSTLLAELDEGERVELLGRVVEPDKAQATLSRQLLASLKSTRRQVYEKLYADTERVIHSDQVSLKSLYPRLPRRVAKELLDGARTDQIWQLRRTRRVPLLLAQRAREMLEVLDEDQALIGLFRPELAGEDTHRLIVGMLARMPRWPKNLRLQLRNETLEGSLLGHAGPGAATVQRTIVRSTKGFQAFDDQGQALGGIAGGSEGIYRAALDTLSREQLARLNLPENAQAARLASEVRVAVTDERQQIARYLWPERVGAKASAACVQSVVNESSPHPGALVRKVRKLYPSLNAGQVAGFLDKQGSDHLSRAKAVQALEQQFEALHRALKSWTKDQVSMLRLPGPLRDYRLSREHAMEMIQDCWKHMAWVPDESGPGLVLDGMALGGLPTLPTQVDFAQVRRLSMKNMQLNDEVAYFLKHFKGLHDLDLARNHLTRLPEVLSQMPGLERLYLDKNKLQLTEYTQAKLAGFKNLKVLSLSGNPLLDPPAVGRMFELRTLALRDCRLKDFPGGLLRPPYLELVDLRENDISVLPEWLSSAPRRVAGAINLRLNPLNHDSRTLLLRYRNDVGIGMGFLEDDIARLNEQKARELWIDDVQEGMSPTKQATWSGLKDEPASEGLFKLLAELGGTADATHVREDMTRRVWRVLEAGAGDADLRAELFERAATPLNCDDTAAISFSDLEVLVEIHDASKLVKGGQLTAKPLLHLAKGLFRLDRLEQYAQAYSAEHPMADPLEVSLAYRTGLADKLHLPGQPRHMRFARLSGVTAEDLNVAAAQLRSAELSSEMLNYFVELPLWVRYLKQTFSRQFEVLNEPFNQRMNSVLDQSLSLPDVEYRNQMDQILQEQGIAQRAELERLSEEALKLSDMASCAIAL